MAKSLKVFASRKKTKSILHLLGISYKHGMDFGKILIVPRKRK